jgi:hypothetical protein
MLKVTPDAKPMLMALMMLLTLKGTTTWDNWVGLGGPG